MTTGKDHQKDTGKIAENKLESWLKWLLVRLERLVESWLKLSLAMRRLLEKINGRGGRQEKGGRKDFCTKPCRNLSFDGRASETQGCVFQ